MDARGKQGVRAASLLAAVLALGSLAFTVRRHVLEMELASGVSHGDITRVRRALAVGADPNGKVAAAGELPKGVRRPFSRLLCMATRASYLPTVDALLAAGANPVLSNSTGETPLSAAAEVGNPLLIQRFLGLPSSPEGLSRALEHACLHGDAATVRALLARHADSNGAPVGRPPLVAAIVARSPECIRLLLASGANPNARSWDGEPVLLMSLSGQPSEIPALLLDAGADPDATGGEFHETALCSAAGQGNLPLLKALLRSGAGINNRGSGGKTALLSSVAARQPQATKFLLQKGAEVDLADREGRTALWWAVKNSLPTNTLRALLKAGANAGRKDMTGTSPRDLAAQRHHSLLIGPDG